MRPLAVILAALFLTTSAHAAWQQADGPILRPTQAWEGSTVQEPTVIKTGGRYRMWYTGGFWTTAVGYAESLDGIHWRKANGPVLGAGAGGQVGQAAHNFVVADGRRLYAFYSAVDDGREVENVALSLDGIHWRVLGTALRLHDGERGFGNVSVWNDGRRWRMLVETFDADGIWRIRRAGSTAFPLHWHRSTSPLADLCLGGMFGGPTIRRTGRRYRIWYHAALRGNLPTEIYSATSLDLNHWTGRQLLIRRDQAWEYDQVADPSLAGRFLYFSGMNNTAGTGAIGVAWKP